MISYYEKITYNNKFLTKYDIWYNLIMDISIKSSRVVMATDSAVKKLQELKLAEDSENTFLRMGEKPGGCSGYSYEMSLIQKSSKEILLKNMKGSI